MMKSVLLLMTTVILGVAMENNTSTINIKNLYTYESVAGVYSSGNNSGQLVKSYLLHDNTFCFSISSMSDENYIAGKWSQEGNIIHFNEIRKPSPAFKMIGKKDAGNNSGNAKKIDFYGYSLANAMTVVYGVSHDGNPPKEMRRLVERGQTTFSKFYSLPFEGDDNTTIFFAVQTGNPDYKDNTVPVYFEQFQIKNSDFNHFLVLIDTKALEKPFIAKGEWSDNTIIFKNDYKGLVVEKSSETMRMDKLYGEVKSNCVEPVMQKSSDTDQILPIKQFKMTIPIPSLDNPYYHEQNSPNGRIIFNG